MIKHKLKGLKSFMPNSLKSKAFDKNKEYMYTIVFTSSLEGDLFNGAVGSALWIDEVNVVTE